MKYNLTPLEARYKEFALCPPLINPEVLGLRNNLTWTKGTFTRFISAFNVKFISFELHHNATYEFINFWVLLRSKKLSNITFNTVINLFPVNGFTLNCNKTHTMLFQTKKITLQTGTLIRRRKYKLPRTFTR